MHCKNCGASVEPNSTYCSKCGARLPDIININEKQTQNSGCFARLIYLILIFIFICVALALFVLALPWMLLIGFIFIGIAYLMFFAG